MALVDVIRKEAELKEKLVSGNTDLIEQLRKLTPELQKLYAPLVQGMIEKTMLLIK